MAWLTSKDMKVHQRKMNKMVRDLNENIRKDDLWQGRFTMKQVAAQREVYFDHSGAELWVVLEMKDRKTGHTKQIRDTVNHYYMWNGGHLWWEMNNFIVEDCGVWEENPTPNSAKYKEKTNEYVKKGWPY